MSFKSRIIGASSAFSGMMVIGAAINWRSSSPVPLSSIAFYGLVFGFMAFCACDGSPSTYTYPTNSDDDDGDGDGDSDSLKRRNEFYGVNQSSGLPMENPAFDIGGNMSGQGPLNDH